jgi:tRNA pseudouridine55 synthase
MKNNSKLRKVSGVLLLDKPVGMTSNAALQTVKTLYAAQKAGHTGSLDPLASGMLPLCFGEATKFAQFLLESNKSYQVTAKLGVTTTTGDAEGEVVENKPVAAITVEEISAIIAKFTGEITQVPSMFSAIKYHGQPLYKLARQGITVERPGRKVTIHALRLLKQTLDELQFDIHCSKGTYVRTLIEDIGKELGCGAHVIALRRLAVDPYQAAQVIDLEKIKQLAMNNDFLSLDSLLLPIESMLSVYQEIRLSDTTAYYLRQSRAVFAPHNATNKLVKLFTKDGKFLGLGEVLADGKIAPKKLVQ